MRQQAVETGDVSAELKFPNAPTSYNGKGMDKGTPRSGGRPYMGNDRQYAGGGKTYGGGKGQAHPGPENNGRQPGPPGRPSYGGPGGQKGPPGKGPVGTKGPVGHPGKGPPMGAKGPGGFKGDGPKGFDGKRMGPGDVGAPPYKRAKGDFGGKDFGKMSSKPSGGFKGPPMKGGCKGPGGCKGGGWGGGCKGSGFYGK